LAQRIDEVKALPTNDQLVVSFTPDSGVTPLTGTVVAPVVQSVQTTLTAPGRYISGSLQRRVAHLSVKATPASSAYQGSVLVSGRLGETDGSAKVDLFGEPLGGQRFKIATVTAAADGSGGAAFKYKVSGLTVSTRLVAEWSGDAVAIGGSASTHVDVRQRVSLRAGQTGVAPGAAVKLVADVRPGAAGQTVWFERKTAAGWTTIRGVKLLADLTAALIWQPPAGASTVRARVAATAVNAAGASAQLTITARGR
jgi:hypothetical protein